MFVRGGEVFLIGATIPPYQEKNTPSTYKPDRARRLLLNKREIKRLYTSSEEKRLTLVPLIIYNCNQKLKLDVGVASKKNAKDKREEMKKKESKTVYKKTITPKTMTLREGGISAPPEVPPFGGVRL